jgi:D-sedoheptulose 7-phosphate isomerase
VTSEPTSFLYPFIDAEERDATQLLADLAVSARAKIAESYRVRTTALQDCKSIMEAAAADMADRFAAGGRLFTFGNGGSATDADATVALFQHPPAGRPLPALSLVEDRAVLTALANDVGYELVFSRQIIAHARPGDIAIGFSTSGGSVNVVRAFEEASRRHLLTVGLCGYDGGAMASSAALDHCLIVRSDSVHRIQEAQDAVTLALWQAVQRHLHEEGRAP